MSETFKAVCHQHQEAVYLVTRTGRGVVVGIASADADGHNLLVDFLSEHAECPPVVVTEENDPDGYRLLNQGGLTPCEVCLYLTGRHAQGCSAA